MTDIVPVSSNKLYNRNDSDPRYERYSPGAYRGTTLHLDTNGAYPIVESAAPGCASPMDLFIATRQSILWSPRVATASRSESTSSRCRPGLASSGRPASWRNISSEPGRMVVITPGGFEQCVQTIRNNPPEKLEASLHPMAATSSDCISAHIEEQHST